MDSRAQDLPSEEGNLAGEVMDSIGENAHEHLPDGESHEGHMQGDGNSGKELPAYIKARLGRQETKHRREMREMQARMAEMQSHLEHRQPPQPDGNSYGAPVGSDDERIHKAVAHALQYKEMEERKAKEAENAAKVRSEYQDLHNHLDAMNDKYDDFEEVVRGEDAKFTPHMRDAALFLPKKGAGSAGEVLYHLGKHPEELERVSRLHPMKQASELVKLSHALISGGEPKASTPSRPLGQIKSNPVTNSHAITEKTSPSEIRARMKAGKFK